MRRRRRRMVGMLADMGFTSAQAKKALKETSGDAERAVEWLFSHPEETGEDTSTTATFSADSHKGPSVQSGHSVAHIHIGDEVGGGGDCGD
ncbi:hypothetical protein D9611_013211 [Ephemerocybe angulata]|uniref:UBA domain-containing protein n=1 Tax=Ephemerocybe angulata TaxID=980116 RepID=A0A8H5BTA1_9AGAR|nr:hypothetical protein D9611_013211 [Tulosesus angulatus]